MCLFTVMVRSRTFILGPRYIAGARQRGQPQPRVINIAFACLLLIIVGDRCDQYPRSPEQQVIHYIELVGPSMLMRLHSLSKKCLELFIRLKVKLV